MTERAHLLPCPVCLGVSMERVVVGRDGAVEIDLCRRCGGLWVEQGEVQRLRSHEVHHLGVHFDAGSPLHPAHCRECHVPLDRDAEQCQSCGRTNRLECPECLREMNAVWYRALRLDICPGCRGTWFDHHELEAIWGPRFDLALSRRQLTRKGVSITAAEAGSDLLFHALFFSPELLATSAAAAGDVLAASGSAVAQIPESLAASPDMAAGVIQAIGDAAIDVFETVVEIVAAVLD